MHLVLAEYLVVVFLSGFGAAEHYDLGDVHLEIVAQVVGLLFGDVEHGGELHVVAVAGVPGVEDDSGAEVLAEEEVFLCL